MLSYDVLTGLFVLLDNDKAVMVDVSTALDDKSKLWATERLSTVIVLGHVERTEVKLTFDNSQDGGRLLMNLFVWNPRASRTLLFLNYLKEFRSIGILSFVRS